MNVLINGFSGRMGQEIQNILTSPNSNDVLLGGFDADGFKSIAKGSVKNTKENDSSSYLKALNLTDVILDFSNQEANDALQKKLKVFAKKNPKKIPAVLIGTTALKKSTIQAWQKFSSEENFKCLLAPNTSIGIFLLSKCLRYLSEHNFLDNLDIVMDEIHHKHKLDSPSGTALLLQQSFGEKLGSKLNINTHRGGGVPGIHSIKILGEQEMLELKHTAFSRKLFAEGAIKLAIRLHKLKPGFYTLWDL